MNHIMQPPEERTHSRISLSSHGASIAGGFGVGRSRRSLFALGGCVAALAVVGPLASVASGGPASDRGVLEGAVTTLESSLPVEKQCEQKFASLSRDLSAGKVSTRSALKSRQTGARNCFTRVTKQFRAARAELHQVLASNAVSEQSSQARVTDKGWVVAYSWLLARHVTSFSPMLSRATSLVNGARLGRPLGGGSADATYTLLSLRKHRTLLADACAGARENALG